MIRDVDVDVDVGVDVNTDVDKYFYFDSKVKKILFTRNIVISIRSNSAAFPSIERRASLNLVNMSLYKNLESRIAALELSELKEKKQLIENVLSSLKLDRAGFLSSSMTLSNLKVLLCLIDGCGIDLIAELMNVTTKTVKNYKNSLSDQCYNDLNTVLKTFKSYAIA